MPSSTFHKHPANNEVGAENLGVIQWLCSFCQNRSRKPWRHPLVCQCSSVEQDQQLHVCFEDATEKAFYIHLGPWMQWLARSHVRESTTMISECF